MAFNILVEKTKDAGLFDHGDNYTAFEDANRRARELFSEYTGRQAQWESDGNYQDKETGLTVMVGEL